MKRMILLLFILTIPLMAQNTNKASKYISTNDILFKVLENNTDRLRFGLVPITYTVKDSLVGADTCSIDFENKYLFTEINAYNAGSNLDTLVIEYWDMFNARWTSQMNGLYENLTNDIVPNNELITIENGKSKRYRINEPYAGKVRLRTALTTGQSGDKVYIGFIGKN